MTTTRATAGPAWRGWLRASKTESWRVIASGDWSAVTRLTLEYPSDSRFTEVIVLRGNERPIGQWIEPKRQEATA